MDSETVLEARTVSALSSSVRAFSGSLGDVDADVSPLPPRFHPTLRRLAERLGAERHPDAVRTLGNYCSELDEIAEAVRALDERERELRAELSWWAERIEQLEKSSGAGREIALFRGRMSGAQAMLRHYGHERRTLLQRHRSADERCTAALEALLA